MEEILHRFTHTRVFDGAMPETPRPLLNVEQCIGWCRISFSDDPSFFDVMLASMLKREREVLKIIASNRCRISSINSTMNSLFSPRL